MFPCLPQSFQGLHRRPRRYDTVSDSAGLDAVAGQLQGTGSGTAALPSAPSAQTGCLCHNLKLICYQLSKLGLEGTPYHQHWRHGSSQEIGGISPV